MTMIVKNLKVEKVEIEKREKYQHESTYWRYVDSVKLHNQLCNKLSGKDICIFTPKKNFVNIEEHWAGTIKSQGVMPKFYNSQVINGKLVFMEDYTKEYSFEILD